MFFKCVCVFAYINLYQNCTFSLFCIPFTPYALYFEDQLEKIAREKGRKREMINKKMDERVKCSEKKSGLVMHILLFCYFSSVFLSFIVRISEVAGG